MMTSTNSGRHAFAQRRKAAAAVELAMILLPLTMILLVCIDIGRAAYSYIALQNAVRAGAGYGAMNSSTGASWSQNVETTTKNEMQNQTGYNSANVTFPNGAPAVTTDTAGPDSTLRYVTVTAEYPFQPLVSYLTTGAINLTATVKLPLLRN